MFWYVVTGVVAFVAGYAVGQIVAQLPDYEELKAREEHEREQEQRSR